MIRAVVWNEFVHERENPLVQVDLPRGHPRRHRRGARTPTPASTPRTATLDQPENGLPLDRLKETDVLLWWGHKAHGAVDDATVDRVAQRVHEGMGLIVLHSGHFSKIFKRLMGTPCSLRWREAGERERLWAVNRSHPIMRRPRRPHRAAQRGDVRRALPGARAARDRADLLVRGRRGLPLRPHLPARRRAASSISAPATRPIRPTTTPPCRRSCATPSTGPTTRPPPGTTSPRRRTCPSTRAPEKITVKGASLHKAGEEGFR